jgi:phosphoserine phosphatase
VLTVLCVMPVVPMPLYCAIAATIASVNGNIHKLSRLSDEKDTRAVIEYVFASPFGARTPQFNELSRKLQTIASAHQVDIALQEESLLRGRKRLVVFDMAGTLLTTDALRALARVMGVERQMDEVAAQCAHDEAKLLRAQYALLRGLTFEHIARVRASLRLATRARTFCRTLKRLGYKLAAISTQISVVADWVKSELALDYVFCNSLEMKNDVATG